MTYSCKINTIKTTLYIKIFLLKRIDELLDIGMLFDSKLTFNLHFDTITTVDRSRIGLTFRYYKAFKDVFMLKILYSTLV